MYSLGVGRLSRILGLILCLSSTVFAWAQITGHVYNNDEPLAGVKVAGLKSDSTTIEIVVTDSIGFFKILRPDVTKLVLSYPGFADLELAVTNPQDLGKVKLETKSIGLKDVVVESSLVTQNAVEENILVTKQMREGTSSAIQMLGKVKGFNLNPLSESLTIEGMSDFPKLVNGNEISAERFKAINPKRIQSIRVLRYPPGKYALCPIVLDLVLFEDYIGYDISLRGNGQLNPRKSNMNSENAGASLAIARKNINYYLDLSQNYGKSGFSQGMHKIMHDDYEQSSLMPSTTNPNATSSTRTGFVSLGADWRPAKGQFLYFNVSGILNGSDASSDLDIFSRVGTERYNYVQRNNDDCNGKNLQASTTYNAKFGEKFQLNFDFNYQHYYGHEYHTLAMRDQNSITDTRSHRNIYFGVITGNYFINPKWMIQLQIPLTVQNVNINTEIPKQPKFSQTNVYQGYSAAVNFAPSNKINLYAGGGLSSHREFDADNHYVTKWNVAPYIAFQYKFSRIGSLYLNSACNNATLSPNELSPVRSMTDIYSYSEGNPFLQTPRIYKEIARLTFSRIISVEYNLNYNPYTVHNYIYPDGENFIFSLTNIREMRHLFKVWNNFQINDNLNFYVGAALMEDYQWKKGEDKSNYYSWDVSIDCNYYLSPTKIHFYAGFYMSQDKGHIYDGYNRSSSQMLTLAMSRNFFKNRFWVSIGGNIPLGILSKNAYSIRTIPGYYSKSESNKRLGLSYLQINMRFALGNGKVRARQSQSSGLDKINQVKDF